MSNKKDLKDTGCGLYSSGSGSGPVADCFKLGDKPSISIKGDEFHQLCGS
jgi:hypothetical protein